jgi:hypothetical protein
MSLNHREDQQFSSLAAAVEFSKTNNLLGVLVSADLLVNSSSWIIAPWPIHTFPFQIPVPSLIQGIRDGGLLVGVYGSPDKSTTLAASIARKNLLVDAVLENGLVVYMEHPVVDLLWGQAERNEKKAQPFTGRLLHKIIYKGTRSCSKFTMRTHWEKAQIW